MVSRVNVEKKLLEWTSSSINILCQVTPVILGRKCLCINVETTLIMFFFYYTNSFVCTTVPTYLYFQGKSLPVSSES